MKIKITYRLETSEQTFVYETLEQLEKKIKGMGRTEIEYHAYKIVETGKSTKETFLIQ